MGLLNSIKSATKKAAIQSAKGGRKVVRGTQNAIGVSTGLVSDTVGMTAGAGVGLLKGVFGSSPIQHAIIPKLGVAVPIGLKKSSIARASMISAGVAAGIGVATSGNTMQHNYQYPDEEDGQAPQFKNDLGANGNLVLQSYYAGRKY